MARDPLVPIRDEARSLMRRRRDELGMSDAELARASELGPHVVCRLLGSQKSARTSTLRCICRGLGLEYGEVSLQQELELEIDPQFVQDVQLALSAELERLQAQVGPVTGFEVTGIVGIELRGPYLARHAIERRFPIPLRRKISAT